MINLNIQVNWDRDNSDDINWFRGWFILILPHFNCHQNHERVKYLTCGMAETELIWWQMFDIIIGEWPDTWVNASIRQIVLIVIQNTEHHHHHHDYKQTDVAHDHDNSVGKCQRCCDKWSGATVCPSTRQCLHYWSVVSSWGLGMLMLVCVTPHKNIWVSE